MVVLASGVLIQVGRLSAPSSSSPLSLTSLSVCDGCLGCPSDMVGVCGVLASQHYYCFFCCLLDSISAVKIPSWVNFLQPLHFDWWI